MNFSCCHAKRYVVMLLVSLRKLRVFLFIIFLTVAFGVSSQLFFSLLPLMLCIKIKMVIKINLPCGMLKSEVKDGKEAAESMANKCSGT